MNTHHQYLIIGGSTKCGTTSVFNYFEFHPQVCACIKKESRYFLEDSYKLIAKQRSNKLYNNFEELFLNCNPNSIRLEATPDYLYSKFAADKIKAEIPSSKLIFILRDPQTRLESWYKFALLNGLIPAETTFEKYILNQQTTTPNSAQHLRSLEQSKYADYLEYYYHVFENNNLLICFYEELQKDPELFCKQICKFVGIDENYFSDFDFKIYNKSVPVKSVGTHKLFRKFKRGVRPITKLLPQNLRKKLKLAGYNIEQSYTALNAAEASTKIERSAELKNFLEKYFQDSNKKITELTGKILPWQTS